MTDGGCVSNQRPIERDTDLTDAFAAGEAAQRARTADYLDDYARRMGERFDPDTAGTVKPIVLGLASTIRAGIHDPDGVSHD